MMSTFRAFCVFALLLAFGCSEGVPEVDPSTRRDLSQGQLVGFSQDGTHVWHGIPFAKAPEGPLRWRAPQAPEPWQGSLEALTHGPACPQLDFSGDFDGDEDCLTLNIYAPADLGDDDSSLPVMVFIHGGGNSIGSAEVYDGSRLASENRVVIVTVQYRLGVLGWFTHPALREAANNPDDASGNFATLDLIRSLEWVRDNIAVFGGDPSRVTIFGESAGGVNVYSLLLSPRAKGLFHGAISQSGFVTSFPLSEATNFVDDANSPGLPGSSNEVIVGLLEHDGLAEDRTQAKSLLASMDSAAVRAFLYEKSAEGILDIFKESGSALGGMYFAPFVFQDGRVIPAADAMTALENGTYNQVPAILGTNRDEHRLFQAFSSRHIAHLGSLPVRIKDFERYQVVTEYGSKLWKASGVDEPATAMRAIQGPSIYGYRFDWDEEPYLGWLDLSKLIGAGHAIELLFVFGGTNSEIADGFIVDDVESAEELSRQMRSYWAQFAATGKPGRGQAGDLPEWPSWASKSDEAARFLVFDSSRDGGIRTSDATLTTASVIAAVATDPRIESNEDRCEVYASFVQWSAAMTPEEYETVDGGICRAYPLEARTPAG